MNHTDMTMTYVGGPTALLEVGGLRLLTDPVFDPAGTEYPTSAYTLRKNAGPAVDAETIGQIDVVLLSHDHHWDNLDRAGRTLLPNAGRVLTTPAGAERLGGNATGLAPWESVDVPLPDGRILRVTGTPARHGPAGGDRGPVTGFVLALTDAPDQAVYISGDTVWYEGVAEGSRRFTITKAVLFLGAARVKAVGWDALTMTAEEGVLAAHAFPQAIIIPLHFEGWDHFTESRNDVERVFAANGIQHRLRWLEPGKETILEGALG